MSQKILGLSGVKQSGKTTAMNFLYGYQMRLNDVVQKFLMDDKGNLLVNAVMIDDKGEETEEVGILDVERRDQDFIGYASMTIWPYVKSFSFADPLKVIAIELFGLSEDQCYGTDKDKNTTVNIKWEDIPAYQENWATGFMTAREFLQCFGTDICRTIKDTVWVDSCINRILETGTELAIVSDCRFPNEVDAVQKAGGKVIRLTRNNHPDSHASEQALNDFDGFDYTLDNSEMNIDETNKALLKVLREWGWLRTKA